MKKILFATTALVVTAGAAAADITLSGSANMGVKYDESRVGGETYLFNELDFGINASSTTDSGIEFGASIDLDASMSDDFSTLTTDDQGLADGSANDDVNFDPEVYISSGGLTLTVGNVDPASDPFGMGDIGFDGIGVDDIGEGAAPKSDANVIVEYAMGDYSFSASADGTTGDDFAVAFQGSVSGLGFGIAYEENGGVDNTWVDLSYGFGDVTVGAFYVDSTNDGYGFEVAYSAGDLTVNFGYSKNDGTGADAYGVGASYDLGSGLAVAGGVGDINGTTKADFGVTMSF